jgi:hypothetical protein
MVAQLHLWLAYASLLGIAILGLEAARRAWRQRSRGVRSERLEALVLIAIVITSAGGLGMLAAGSGPREPLHFMYAILALGSLPLANSLIRNAEPRRQALVTLAAAVVALVLITRLFQTG